MYQHNLFHLRSNVWGLEAGPLILFG